MNRGPASLLGRARHHGFSGLGLGLLGLLLLTSLALAESPESLIQQCETAEHGEPERAIALSDRALEQLPDSEQWLRFQALGCKAWALSSLGRRIEGVRLSEQLEGLAAALTVPEERVRALRRVSALYHRLGELERSTEALRVALEITETENLAGQRVDLLVNMGARRAEARQHDLAIALWLRALDLVEDDEDPGRTLPIRYNLGLVYRHAGRLEEAVEIFKSLLEPLSAPGMEIRLASLNTVLGSIHLDMGKLEKAEKFLSVSASLHETLDNPAEHTALLIDMTRLKIARGQIEEALAYSIRAVEEAERADYHFSIAGALTVRALALEAAGLSDQALVVERDRSQRVEQWLVAQQRSELDKLEAELGVALRERELADLRIEREAQARRMESQQQRQRLLTVVLAALIVLGLAVVLTQRLNNRRLALSSRTDELTGLGNRRQANEWLAEAADTTMLLLVDLDHFKELNDTHGHAFGDRVLKEVASSLAGFAARHNGQVARWGGEEFLLMLPGKDGASARAVAAELRNAIAGLRLGLRSGGQLGLTASIGVVAVGAAASDGDVRGWESALLLADELMYQAKRGGRNRAVVLWPDDGARYRVADLKQGEVKMLVV